MRRFLTILVLTFGLLPNASASDLNVQTVGERLDVNFQAIDSKLSEMEALIRSESVYQNYILNLQSIASEIDSKVISLQFLLDAKDLPSVQIQTQIDLLREFKEIITQVQNELRSIEAESYPDAIALANSLSSTASQTRPVIVDIKFPQSLYGKPSPQSHNPNNKEVLITWVIKVKSKNLITQIGIVTPPDWSGIWGNYESVQNLDQTTTSKTQPEKDQSHLLLIERQFKDGWIFETYAGQQWTNFDKDWKNGNSNNTIMVWAATGADNLGYTCRVYMSDNYATFDYLTPGCTQEDHLSIPVPQISQSQAALDNTISENMITIWQNREKYKTQIEKLNSYHKVEDSKIVTIELLLSTYKQLSSEVNIFEKQQNDRLAQLKAERSLAAAKAATTKKTTITCVKGKLIKKVTAVKPKCPTGYKVKK